MKKFSITMVEHSGKFEPTFNELIEGDDLLELLSKLILTIGRLHHKLLQEQFVKNVLNDDDIPF